MSLFHGPHAFACDWLAQDSAVCRTRRSLEQSGHYRAASTVVSHYVEQPDTYRPGHAIATVADDLVSNRRQAISNHLADLFMVLLRATDIMLHLLNEQCFETGREVGHLLVIDGFALW